MSVSTLQLLSDLQAPWGTLRVDCVEEKGRSEETIPDVFPFISITDFKRMLWIHKGGDPRWAPEHVFLGVRRTADGIRPIEFHWVDPILPDPTLIENRTPSPLLVDDAGNRKPITPVMTGGLTLEAALLPELSTGGDLPAITAISLSALIPSDPEEVTSPLFHGFYQRYFPWLLSADQLLEATSASESLRAAYAAAVPYIQDRSERIQVVQRALAAQVGGPIMKMNTMVRLRWVLPPPRVRPVSLERVFYELRATETVPFIRYFPPSARSATPLMKLGLAADGTPLISDPQSIAQYINIPSPVTSSAVIMARIPIPSQHTDRAAFLLYMFEDGTCDITLEVPQRGMTYIAAVATDAQRILGEVLTQIGFPAGLVPRLHDLHATYNWTHPEPRRSTPMTAARLKERVAILTPFLELSPVQLDESALLTFTWRATSNYESEPAQFAFITQMVLREEELKTFKEEGAALKARYEQEISKQFGVTMDGAAAIMERWYERRADAVAPAAIPGAGSMAVPKHSTGVNISIRGAHPKYSIMINGIESYAELQRVSSVIGVLLGASSADLALGLPSKAAEVGATAIQIADSSIAAAAAAGGGGGVMEPAEIDALAAGAEPDLGELDPGMAGLLADLGFGGGDDDVPAEDIMEQKAAVAEFVPAAAAAGGGGGAPAVAPDPDAVAAAIEEECMGNPWKAGDPALKIQKDYYMAKLKREDKVLFGYSIKKPGGTKSYSKACQRRDERQPDSMTLVEYARIKRCYEDRVRFVDLPPQKPSDLPNIPKYTPKKKNEYPDEYFYMDPETGKPMWIVYGYENKTRPGEFFYLMCSELWCERDNLPLIRAEFESTTGRGFEKPPNTCPFCAGTIIADMKSPKPGESVIKRLPKSGTTKIHGFIGTMTHGEGHPDGYPLPCCDLTPRLLKRYLDDNYLGKLVFGRGEAAAADVEEMVEAAVAAPPAPAPAAEEIVTVDYTKILGTMNLQYILGADKTLEAGKIAALPSALDSFFGQTSARSLETRGIRTTFVDGAHLFVRVGVDNRIRTPGYNLFAALAPLLGYNTAEQVLTFMRSRSMVRAFEAANYGTLVHEFAARSTLTDAEITASLQSFATENGYSLGPARPHVIRLYKAWSSFLQTMSDPKQPKQLRHIEHLLAHPGVFMPRGLLLVVLEQDGAGFRVVCPTFGIPPASIFGEVPIAFMWHDRRTDRWEPIVLYANGPQAVKIFGDTIPLPASKRAGINRWIREWRSSSLGCGRPTPPPHVWTPERDTRGLPRLSQLRRSVQGMSPSVMVRDRSNRLAGVLYTKPVVAAAAGGGGGGSDPALFVPCLDDGYLAETMPRIYEADMIPLSPIDSYMRFYADLGYPGLAPTKLLAQLDREGGSKIVGFMTAVGSMCPIAPTALGAAGLPALPVQQIDAFPWERDSLILQNPANPVQSRILLEEATASVEEQLAEAYQHVRLSLSRWLARDPAGPAMRNDLGRLLKSSLPLYEKQKRLDIRLEPILRQWAYPEQTTVRKALSLLREDCLSLPGEAACAAAGACRWSAGRCLIHVPYRTAGTDPIRIFAARLSDEILRYSGARAELFENEVPSIRTPRGILRIGNQLMMATKPKETGAAVVERIGLHIGSASTFTEPEELLRLRDDEEDEAEPLAPAPPMAAADTEVAEDLPASWKEKGLTVPRPVGGLENARMLAFATGTGRSLQDWSAFLKARRQKYPLPGDPERPFQWSFQDFYVMTYITLSNLLFVRQNASGNLQMDYYIAPPFTSVTAAVTQPIYMIFWGTQQLLVTKGKAYRFTKRELPADLVGLIERSQPMRAFELEGTVEPREEKPVPAAPLSVKVASAEAAEVDAVQPPAPQYASEQPAAPAQAFNIEGSLAAAKEARVV